MRRGLGFTASCFVAAICSGPASALPSFEGRVELELTISGFADALGTPIPQPSTLHMDGQARVFDERTEQSGNASAQTETGAQVEASDPLALAVGEGIALSARASGSAGLPAPASASALARTDGLLFLDNRSLDEAVMVSFVLTLSFLASATADPDESALAELGVLLESLSGGTLFQRFVTVPGTPAGDSDSDALVFGVMLRLEPGEFDELGVVADATGSARVVPEPRSFALLALGLVALLVSRRWGTRHR